MRIGAYMNIRGERLHEKPNPADYVYDDENLTLEYSHVVTVYVGESGGGLTPVARHSLGSKEPDDAAIKWCIMRYAGDHATVSKVYHLTL